MKWEFKNGIPIYLQIIDQIKRQIVSGELAPGSRIPAVRDLAKEAGVNPNTMQRALTQLEQEGLLYTQRTSGRFVTQEEEIMKQTRMQLSDVTSTSRSFSSICSSWGSPATISWKPSANGGTIANESD